MLLSFPFTPHFDGVRSQWGITVSFEFHGFAFYFMLYFITRFLLLQAMPSASFARSESLLLFSAHIHTHTQAFVGSLAALTFSDLLATPAAGISQVKGCMARPAPLCSVEGLNSTGFCVWLFLLVIYKLSTCHAFQVFSDRALCTTLMWAAFVPDMVPLETPAMKHIFSAETGLLKACHGST